MASRFFHVRTVTTSFVSCSLVFAFAVNLLSAPPIVPGTGTRITQVGDDFEDAKWQFFHNFPKSSKEQDERTRTPSGMANNRRWYEGIKRGQPDQIQLVQTPHDGPEGKYSLMLRTRNSGVPNAFSYKMEQDDFVANVYQRLGGKIPVHQSPNVVVRVFVPVLRQWENRTGPSFGFRLALDTHIWKFPDEEDMPKRGFFRSSPKKQFMQETYWPGMFVDLRSETDRGIEKDSARFRIRGVRNGQDIPGPEIDEAGWWTLGMSVTPDGMVHYYISKGLDDLTADDFITSQYPYGYKAERFRTFFFNVCNRHDGQTWSTPWIVDDCEVYYVPNPRMAGRLQVSR